MPTPQTLLLISDLTSVEQDPTTGAISASLSSAGETRCANAEIWTLPGVLSSPLKIQSGPQGQGSHRPTPQAVHMTRYDGDIILAMQDPRHLSFTLAEGQTMIVGGKNNYGNLEIDQSGFITLRAAASTSHPQTGGTTITLQNTGISLSGSSSKPISLGDTASDFAALSSKVDNIMNLLKSLANVLSSPLVVSTTGSATAQTGTAVMTDGGAAAQALANGIASVASQTVKIAP